MAEIETHRFDDDGSIPNNPRLPLLVYRRALTPTGDPAAAFEALFAAHGWTGSWRNGIYGHHHFHSTAHEVLGIARGAATVRFGGERGATATVSAGDVVVIPAGVGHKRLDAGPDLLVVGAYPEGQRPDLCTGRPEDGNGVRERIAAVPVPATDPVHGADGPLLRHWAPASLD